MREIDVSTLRDTIAQLLPEINYNIPPDVLAALRDAVVREESELGRQTLQQLARNYEVAGGSGDVCRRPFARTAGSDHRLCRPDDHRAHGAVPSGAFSAGVVGIIGKGELHGDDMAAFTKYGAIYLAAIGGLGALLSKHITAASVVAYEDLGPEALYALELERFPAVVIIDRQGRNFHEQVRTQWRRSRSSS